MKYENLQKASGLCEQIRKQEQLLESLNESDVVVSLRNERGSGVFQTIGADERYEHPLTPIAIAFVEQLRKETKAKIEVLKSELDPL